ncbi:hypothetical protein HYW44_04435 [Candidatus Daviesbacteria bacterium]|nr:hypothetical protein [Candidatus Daviesbacteria bacterium]
MSERIKILQRQIFKTDPLVVLGGSVRLLGEKRLEMYAGLVSEKLAHHPNTMLQYSPPEIFKAMIDRRSVVITNPRTGNLLAFAQVWKYGSNDGRDIYEFGSWSAYKDDEYKNGNGRLALLAGPILVREIDPSAQAIAIVEKTNKKAQKIITDFGGIEIEGEWSPYLRTVEGETAYMKKFDITMRGGEENVSSKRNTTTA